MNPKRIILASSSPQRKKLLQFLGVHFNVYPSRIREAKKVKTTCADLVENNALLKAKDAAKKVKEGIVIGADTVIYIGRKKIIGKPRNFKEAKRILKILFARPRWVYTGIAVIDAQTGKTMTDYEKTKIFMSALSDREIESYHRKVEPFDKAGGFDIEGRGSIFIRRIEGCYSNVIGLPMPKLQAMLKKFGVSFLSMFVLISWTGCTTEYNLATQQEERLLYGTEKEIKIGESVAAQVEKQYKVVGDIDVNERVERILNRIVEVSDRRDIVYFIKVLDDDTVNAVSLPGGYVYVFKGLLDKIENDDQLAGVIAHEVGHINAKHSIKKLQASYAAMILQILSTQAGGNVAQGTNFALTALFLEHSQQDEFEADRLGVKYMKKAGYDPNQMIKLLEIIEKEEEKAPVQPYSYWKTHPNASQRKGIVNQEITGRLKFEDYLNLIGNE